MAEMAETGLGKLEMTFAYWGGNLQRVSSIVMERRTWATHVRAGETPKE